MGASSFFYIFINFVSFSIFGSPLLFYYLQPISQNIFSVSTHLSILSDLSCFSIPHQILSLYIFSTHPSSFYFSVFHIFLFILNCFFLLYLLCSFSSSFSSSSLFYLCILLMHSPSSIFCFSFPSSFFITSSSQTISPPPPPFHSVEQSHPALSS